jgi:hypothetical protein
VVAYLYQNNDTYYSEYIKAQKFILKLAPRLWAWNTENHTREVTGSKKLSAIAGDIIIRAGIDYESINVRMGVSPSY